MISRNVLFAIVGVLAVAVGVLGYSLYQERNKPEGVSINVGPGGLKIEGR
jgi:putative flippase GtrA